MRCNCGKKRKTAAPPAYRWKVTLPSGRVRRYVHEWQADQLISKHGGQKVEDWPKKGDGGATR